MPKKPTMLEQHQQYIARCKAHGAKTIFYQTPCCGSMLEDRLTPSNEDRWDTLCACPRCGELYMKITTHEAVVGRVPPGAGPTVLQLEVGRTYRGKKPGPVLAYPSKLVNDRTVIWLSSTEVQYDGPSVRNGSLHPRMARADFLEWVDRDVTDELPKGDYAPWPITKKTPAVA